MRRETIELILSDRGIKPKDHSYVIPKKEVASLLIGQNTVTALPGVCAVTLGDEYLRTETHKGSVTYVEYELVRAISFESKEIADRQAGFV